MSSARIATFDEMAEHLVAVCWPRRALEGDHPGAKALAEATLERLLGRGLQTTRAADDSRRFDPLEVNHALVSRAGEPCDPAFPEMIASTREQVSAFHGEPRWLRFQLRREWLGLPRDQRRPLVLRLPLPLREPIRNLHLEVTAPGRPVVSQKIEKGRVELRLLPIAAANPPVIAELSFEFFAAATEVSLADSSPLASVQELAGEDALWLQPREGQLVCTPPIFALAAELTSGRHTVADFVDAAWRRIFAVLRMGDLDRTQLDREDPLASLLRGGRTDCALAATLFCALCRARGIPARVIGGFLVPYRLASEHSWAEVRVAPGRWAPIDFGSWMTCAGDPSDPRWGRHFLGRIDPRLTCEIAPRAFVGWGSAHPPARWSKLHRLTSGSLEQEIRGLPDGEMRRRDRCLVSELGPAAKM